MPWIYRAWVPTVSGGLSFGTFGEASHPPRAVSANRTDQRDRYLICYRVKDASDVLPPLKWLARRFVKLDGRFLFLCVAKVGAHGGDPRGKMTGHLYLTSRSGQHFHFVRQSAQDAIDYLNSYGGDSGRHDLSEYFEGRYGDLVDSLESRTDFSADFSVNRNGEATISVQEEAARPRAEGGVRRDEDRVSESHATSVVVSQLFYFLRDIGHRHQHHNPDTDTVINLVSQNDDDDLTWRLETLYALFRKIIQYKRVQKNAIFQSSRGTIAYARTFFDICERNINAEDQKMLPYFNFNSVAESIDAAETSYVHYKNIADDGRRIALNVGLALFSIVLSYIGLIKLTGVTIPAKPPSYLMEAAGYLVKYPLVAVALLLVIFIGSKLPFRGQADRFLFGSAMSLWVKPLLRVLNVWSLEVAVIVCGSFVILLSAVMYWALAGWIPSP